MNIKGWFLCLDKFMIINWIWWLICVVVSLMFGVLYMVLNIFVVSWWILLVIFLMGFVMVWRWGLGKFKIGNKVILCF